MSRTLSRLKKEGWLSLATPQRERSSSRIERRISRFFSSCGSKYGAPLELRWEPQGPAHVSTGKSGLQASCEGPLGIALQLVPRPRDSSGVEARNSGFFSRADIDLGAPLVHPQGTLASSRVEPCNSALLSSQKISVRLPVELTIGISVLLSRGHRAVTPAIMF